MRNEPIAFRDLRVWSELRQLAQEVHRIPVLPLAVQRHQPVLVTSTVTRI
jgi:hypothetical protein